MRTFFLGWLTLLSACECQASEPDRHRLIFVSQRSGENLLYVARPDGSDARPIFGGEIADVPGVEAGLKIHREPHWCRQSPDRRFFLDWAADLGRPLEKYGSPPRFMLFLGRSDGGNPRILTPDAGECFAWSPDSKRIAFQVVSPRNLREYGGLQGRTPSTKVYLIGADGSNETLVLERPGFWNVEDWSPDGTKILMNHLTGMSLGTSYNGLVEFDVTNALRRMDELAKSDRTFGMLYPGLPQSDQHLHRITGNTRVVDGRYSPDGRSVACTFEQERDPMQPKFELGLLDLATKEIRSVGKAPGLRGPICWSADGREILFSRALDAQHINAETVDGGPGLGIYAVAPQGGEARYVTSGWSPDVR